VLVVVGAAERLAVHGCQEVDPMSVDIKGSFVTGRAACSLTDSRVVEIFYEKGDRVNGRLRISEGEEQVRVLTPRRSAFVSNAAGPSGTLACETSGRFFFAQPMLGVMSAYDSAGETLWERPLPGFLSIEDDPDLIAGGTTKVLAAIWSRLDLVSKVSVSGEYVAVEIARGKRGFWHAFFHRSGFLVGVIGPWDGLLINTTESGWRFVSGGGSNIPTYVPEREFEVVVEDRSVESLIEHFIAWLVPRPIEREFRVSCAGRPTDEIHWLLGDAFDPKAARESKLALAMLPEDWLEGLRERGVLASVIDRFDPTSDEWRSEYEAALVAAGADALLAHVYEEHIEDSME
jgi:hypothetical protein